MCAIPSLSDARVELPTVQRVTRTDARGRFCLAVPAAIPIRQFRVSAKGREMVIDSSGEQAPVILHFNLLEA